MSASRKSGSQTESTEAESGCVQYGAGHMGGIEGAMPIQMSFLRFIMKFLKWIILS